MSEDLVTFLRARYDERERVARAAANYGAGWTFSNGAIFPSDDARHPGAIATGAYGGLDSEYGEHIALNDPADVLADLAAKRRILDACPPEDDFEQRVRFGSWESCSDGCPADVMLNVVKLMGLPFADHPDYRDEWRPVT